MKLQIAKRFSIAACIWSCSVFGATKISSPLVESAILAKYSLEQLDSVATYGLVLVTSAVDAKLAKKRSPRILACDPKTADAELWMMRLKSLMDSKMEKERQQYLALSAPLRVQKKEWRQCEKNCTCGAYATVLQSIDPTQLNNADKDFAQWLLQKQSAQSSGSARNCARKLTWFCSSSLRQFLKSKN